MADLQTELLACTIGAQTFALEDRSQKFEPLFNSSGQRMGTTVQVSGTGWINGDDKTGFIAAQSAAANSFTLSGQNFAILCYGLTELSVPAAACVNGGPHITFTLEPQADDGGLGRRRFSFDLLAETASEFGGGGGVVEIATFTDTITTRPDGLRTWQREGEINTSGARAACEAAANAFIALFAGQTWVMTARQIRTDEDDRKGAYSVTMTELRSALPAVTGGAQPVDGESSFAQDRDEQHRLVRTWSFDLLLSAGDHVPLLDLLRSGVADSAGGAGLILSESFNVTLRRETRLRALFVVLGGGDGSELMDWRQTFEFSSEAATWTPVSYPGCDPVLVRNSKPFRTLTQQGEAVGAGRWPRHPEPLFPDRLLSPPTVATSARDNIERATSWLYVMAIPPQTQDGGGGPMTVVLAQMLRPAAATPPQFMTTI